MTGRTRNTLLSIGRLLAAVVLLCACAEQATPVPTPAPTDPGLSPAPRETMATWPPASPRLPPPASLEPGATLPPSTPGPPAATPPAVEEPLPAPTDPQLSTLLQPIVDGWRTRNGVPGAVLGIRLADGRIAVVASGETDDAGGAPVAPGHRFRIGSITKTFVAALLLTLVDEGRLDLDVPVERYLPGTPFASQVTLRQLLAHRSGIPDFGLLPEYRQLVELEPSRRWSAAEVIALVADRPLQFRPGRGYAYSNTNYVIAGQIAEAVTGQPLAQLLRQRISLPAVLEATFLEELEPAPAMAVSGHFDITGDGRADNVRAIPYTALVTSGAAAGGMSASAVDLLQFADALFSGGLLSDATLAEMMRVNRISSYGLGLFRAARQGQAAYGHDGELPGFSATFGYLPRAGVSFVAVANQSASPLHALADSALEAVLDEP